MEPNAEFMQKGWNIFMHFSYCLPFKTIKHISALFTSDVFLLTWMNLFLPAGSFSQNLKNSKENRSDQ